MLIQYLKPDVYDKLIGSIADNLRWYNSNSMKFDDIGIQESYADTSTLDLPSFSLCLPPENATNDDKNDNDIANIKIVYGTWKTLSPLQARNKYMWTYYCHCNTDYRQYIRARWMGAGFSEAQARTYFFVTETRRNIVRENALSSLWWKGYLTYDAENKNNPFWLTETLGTTTNLADFVDTINSYNPTRAKGVIKAIAEVMNMLDKRQLNNQLFRDLNRYLNRYAAVVPLDYLSEDDIRELTRTELLRLCKSRY